MQSSCISKIYSAISKKGNIAVTSTLSCDGMNKLEVWQLKCGCLFLLASRPITFPCTQIALLTEDVFITASTSLDIYQLEEYHGRTLIRLKSTYCEAEEESASIAPVLSFNLWKNLLVAGFQDGTIGFFNQITKQLSAHVLVNDAPVYHIEKLKNSLLVASGPNVFLLNPYKISDFRLLVSCERDCIQIVIFEGKLFIQQLETEYIAVHKLLEDNSCVRVTESFSLKSGRQSVVVDFCVASSLIFCLYADGAVVGFNASDFREEAVYEASGAQSLLWESDRLWLFPEFAFLSL